MLWVRVESGRLANGSRPWPATQLGESAAVGAARGRNDDLLVARETGDCPICPHPAGPRSGHPQHPPAIEAEGPHCSCIADLYRLISQCGHNKPRCFPHDQHRGADGRQGARFAVTGELTPKPLIEVRPGKSMIDHVIEFLSLREPQRLIFVCLARHETLHGIGSRLRPRRSLRDCLRRANHARAE